MPGIVSTPWLDQDTRRLVQAGAVAVTAGEMAGGDADRSAVSRIPAVVPATAASTATHARAPRARRRRSRRPMTATSGGWSSRAPRSQDARAARSSCSSIADPFPSLTEFPLQSPAPADQARLNRADGYPALVGDPLYRQVKEVVQHDDLPLPQRQQHQGRPERGEGQRPARLRPGSARPGGGRQAPQPQRRPDGAAQPSP